MILAVVFTAMFLGVWAVAGFAPERLRGEAQRWLEDMTGGPVEFRELRLVVGFPMHLEVGDLRAMGGEFSVERISLRFSALSLLLGRPRASRVILEGAELDVRASSEGGSEAPSTQDWWRLTDRGEAEALIAVVEARVRELLAQPGFADSIELRRSRLRYVDSRPGVPELILELESLAGRLQLSRLRGATSLWMSAALRVGDSRVKRLEAVGSRSRDGGVSMSMSIDAFELTALSALLGSDAGNSGLDGRVQGVVNFSSPSGEAAEIGVDLVFMDLTLPAEPGGKPLESERLALRGRIDVDAEGLWTTSAELQGEAMELRVDAASRRPMNADSALGVSLTLAGVDLSALRVPAFGIPKAWGSAFAGFSEKVEEGRIRRLEARLRTSIGTWGQLLAGGLESPPTGFRVSVDLEDLALMLPDARRVHGLAGRFVWSDHEVGLQTERALLDGELLPELDLRLTGVSHLFAERPSGRPFRAGAVPIPGAELLGETLGLRGEVVEDFEVVLELDFLDHPALFRPLDDVKASLKLAHGVSELQILAGRWGGMQVQGSATLQHSGPRALQVHVEVDAPRDVADSFAVKPVEGVWAQGRFEMGPVSAPSWKQHEAHGAFVLRGAELRLDEVEIDLQPRGELSGRARFDLPSGDELPCEVELELAGGDTESLLLLTGLDPNSDRGTLDVTGSLHGTVFAERPLFAGLEGEMSLRAREGVLDQSLPPLVALALASQTFDAVRSPGSLRYDRWETTLRFEEGWASAEAFELDGPDLRLFAAGRVELSQEPHFMDAEVAIFLFRQLDQALGGIPILNWVLMGQNQNLMAAYFQLKGPWDEPVARVLPLRSITQGPPGDMISAIPEVVQRGLGVLGALLRGGSEPELEPPASRSGNSEP